jgi:hypothetical protein
VVSLLPESLPKHGMSFSPISITCPAHPILLNLITVISGEERNYEVPDYAAVSGLLSVPTLSVPIIASAPCSQTSAVYVLPSM